MKVKSIFAIVSCFIALAFASCNDDLNPIGGTIQPPGDGISTATDTLAIAARTISMQDSVYARTINGVLGQYEDDLFGTIKADYLCQFYFPKGGKFQDNLLQIDSVQFVIDFINYTGDTLAPMGLSVYEATKAIPENFYTNVDPTKYIGEKPTLLASEAYTISGTKIISSSTKQRAIIADLGIDFGKRIYNGWKDKKFTDDVTFNQFLKGAYVTTNFGSGSLIRVLYTSVDIYYKYNDVLGNHNNTADTTRNALFSLSVTPEVMQLNHIKNKNPEKLFEEGTGAAYLKTPAGVYTEVVFPINKIKQNMASKEFKTINTALFTLKGYTEKESSAKYELSRPTTLLLINKDSVESFFSQRKLYDGKTTLVGTRGSNNIYSFGNIASLINTYKNMNLDKDPVFTIIPVEVSTKTDSNGSSYLTGVFNYLQPATSIIRNDEKNMRLELVYSKF